MAESAGSRSKGKGKAAEGEPSGPSQTQTQTQTQARSPDSQSSPRRRTQAPEPTLATLLATIQKLATDNESWRQRQEETIDSRFASFQQQSPEPHQSSVSPEIRPTRNEDPPIPSRERREATTNITRTYSFSS